MVSGETLGMSKRLDVPYDEALTKVREALKEQGFGILTEIDVRATLREKLDQDFRPYTILGACNPRLAHRALESNLDIGLLLPCNVIVYESDGGSVVSAFDPEVGMRLADNAALDAVASEAKALLIKALDQL